MIRFNWFKLYALYDLHPGGHWDPSFWHPPCEGGVRAHPIGRVWGQGAFQVAGSVQNELSSPWDVLGLGAVIVRGARG